MSDQLPARLQDTSATPQGLGEAPASVNCHITVAGRQVQLTLRDTSETRLLERLEAVLAQYPAPEPPRAPASTQGQGEGWCGLHNVQMTLTTKDGRSWYSHRVNGQWCKGRQRGRS
jgi:hypothetical protein